MGIWNGLIMMYYPQKIMFIFTSDILETEIGYLYFIHYYYINHFLHSS